MHSMYHVCTGVVHKHIKFLLIQLMHIVLLNAFFQLICFKQVNSRMCMTTIQQIFDVAVKHE